MCAESVSIASSSEAAILHERVAHKGCLGRSTAPRRATLREGH